MPSNQRNFIDDAVTLLSSKVLVQIAGLLTSIIVARAVGAEGRGLIAALIVVPQLVLTMAAAGIGSATAIYIGKKTWDEKEIIQTVLVLAITSAIVGTGVSLGWLLLFPLEGYTPWLIFASIMIVPGAVLYSYAAGAFLGLKQVPTYAIKSWGPGVGKFALTIIFVMLMGLGPLGAIGAISVSGLIVGGVLLRKLLQQVQVRPKWRSDIARALTSTGFSLSFVFLMMVLIYRANVILIQKYGTLAELGHYSIGTMLAELLWQVPAVMQALLLARSAAAKDGLEFSRKIALVARLTFLFGLIITITLAVVAPLLVRLLYGHEFLPSADIIRALLPGTLAIMIFKIFRQDLSGKGRPWMALWVVFPMLFAVFAAGPFVIPRYGAIGAAYTTSAVYVIGTMALIVIYSRFTKLSLGEILIYRKSDFTKIWEAGTGKIKRILKR